MTTNTSNPNMQKQTGSPLKSVANPTSNSPATSTASQPLITLELIAERKAQKQEEVRLAKTQITNTLHELFNPIQSKNGMEGIMQHVNTGIAVYDGIRTGIKIMQRIRSIFFKSKRR